MKILYISQYFHPEVGATTNRTAAIIEAMQTAGHEVCVLCEMPNHPQGIIFPGYKGKLIVHEKFNGIPVVHLPVIASPKKNFITRIMMYLSFSLSAMVYLLLRRPKYDLLYVTSPPLFTALCGILSKIIFPHRKLVFEVRDLWPDSATELGELNNTLLIKASLALEKRVYKCSDLIVAATNYIGRIVASKGCSSRKVFVSRNGVDEIITQAFRQAPEHQVDEPYTAIFAGNMGLAQNLEPIIHCAELMREDPIRFLFVGDGPRKQTLVKLSKSLKLKNVHFMDQIPKAAMGDLLAKADFGLIGLKDLPVLSGALPVKIFDYMAFMLPIVGSVKGEVADVINEAKAGIVVPPGDYIAMAEALRKLISQPEISKAMAVCGREYVLSHFQRTHLAKILVHELNSRFF